MAHSLLSLRKYKTKNVNPGLSYCVREDCFWLQVTDRLMEHVLNKWWLSHLTEQEGPTVVVPKGWPGGPVMLGNRFSICGHPGA